MKKILNWISIIIAVLAIFLVYLIFTQKDRKGAINVAEETLQYLKMAVSCMIITVWDGRAKI